jgi:hypothetical protein
MCGEQEKIVCRIWNQTVCLVARVIWITDYRYKHLITHIPTPLNYEINWKTNCYDEGLWFDEAKIVFLSYEHCEIIDPKVGLYIKLKSLKIAIRCGNFKTSAKKNI